METNELAKYLRSMATSNENETAALLAEAADKLEAGAIIADWIEGGGYSYAPDGVCDAADKIRSQHFYHAKELLEGP